MALDCAKRDTLGADAACLLPPLSLAVHSVWVSPPVGSKVHRKWEGRADFFLHGVLPTPKEVGGFAPLQEASRQIPPPTSTYMKLGARTTAGTPAVVRAPTRGGARRGHPKKAKSQVE